MAGSAQDQENDGPISAINITPFVDVVLVLLIIFMVTAPALMKDTLGIQLPKTTQGDGKTMSSLGVAINRQGQILLNGTAIDTEALKTEIKKQITQNPELQAVISADSEAKHGDVVKAIDAIKSAGLAKFAIQIQKE